ncbi:MAG TPA: radical SAM protein [Ruminococcaceae bacterium]|jgi:putative pyruvate formate lyase activating enzyme|nr:radical SAM protein [Oscillospiraceae bacterium]HBT90640.1 radical SAM protein [Oscillospiraceae bacterium]HCB92051.1 radical SAM protein [Oscillospiraceae bacterium]
MTLECCNLCPRRCGARREARSGGGFCGMGADAVVARAALHFWEEPCISGKRGSGAVFFTGCSLQCAYCQNYSISAERKTGRAVSPEELAAIFRRLAEQGAHNINLVTPTHFVPAVLRALSLWKPTVPVVYNCGGYESLSTLKMLEGHVDIYLPDMKYADGALAGALSGAPDYVETARAAVLEMARQTGPAVYGADGVMRRGTLVRHLILPGHTRNSLAVLDWLAANLPPGVPVSLMAQYVPCGRAAEFPGLGRRVTAREYAKVQDRLFALNLGGYVQERSSASRAYIPPFNLEGVEGPGKE